MRRFLTAAITFVVLFLLADTLMAVNIRVIHHVGPQIIEETFTVGESILVKFGDTYKEAIIHGIGARGMIQLLFSGGGTVLVHKNFLRKRPSNWPNEKPSVGVPGKKKKKK